MHKVILLTGAPGTGKTTLRRGFTERIVGIQGFDFMGNCSGGVKHAKDSACNMRSLDDNRQR